MRIRFLTERCGFTLAALWLTAISTVVVQCELEGSGDVFLNSQHAFNSLKEEDDGSGDLPMASSGKPSSSKVGKDNGFEYSGDDSVFLLSSIDDEDSVGSSGSDSFGDLVKCSNTNLLCWCVDSDGKEVVGTRKTISDFDISACGGLDKDSVVLTRGNEDKSSTIQPLIKSKPRVVPTAKAKETVTTSQTATLIIGKSTEPAKTADSSGRKGEHGVVKEKVVPLFTHPGILAAIIGGGVVTLLCALLFVMFIIYRMRKKDEGSYPLDSTTKPRLHTYTQVPIKSVYD